VQRENALDAHAEAHAPHRKRRPEARPFLEITTPSNACSVSFSFSPSPSFSRHDTQRVARGIREVFAQLRFM